MRPKNHTPVHPIIGTVSSDPSVAVVSCLKVIGLLAIKNFILGFFFLFFFSRHVYVKFIFGFTIKFFDASF